MHTNVRVPFVLVVLLLLAGNVFAGEFADVIQQAELMIQEKYTTERARKSEFNKLDTIIDNQELTENEKIAEIRREFIHAQKFEITEDNAYSLIFSRPLTWVVHSIAIAYDVDSKTKILVSGESLDSRNQLRDFSDTRTMTKENTISLDVGLGLSLGGSAGVSFNPLSMLSAKASFDAQADASVKGSISQKEEELWSRQRQEKLSVEYKELAQILSDTQVSNCHLSFAVTFKNNGDDNLFVTSSGTVPVYAGKEMMLEAKPWDIAERSKQDILIPAKGTVTIKFRGSIDNTYARKLLDFMTHDSPSIRLEEGQLRITDKNGKISTVIQDAMNASTIGIRCGVVEWRVLKVWQNEWITLRQALWAVNSLYETPPFKFDESGECMSVFDQPFFQTSGEIKDKCVLLKMGDKLLGSLRQNDLDIKINENVQVIVVENLLEKLVADANDEISIWMKSHANELVSKWKHFADRGGGEAQFRLGVCYVNGVGGKQDLVEAVKWFRKSADQGYAGAQYNLGVSYAKGDGVEKEAVEAVKWYRKAADQGYAGAQNNLGVCYDDGFGVEQDATEAAKWYRKAADQGLAEAQFNLGVCYDYGGGVEQDATEAVKWYRKAADQGNAGAQFNLGLCYGYGDGVEKNLAEAVKWYRKATDQGDARAQYFLGDCYANGDGVEKNLAEAVKWYRKAADQGDADAQFILGMCYALGDGVDKDLVEAVKWYRKAADQGDAEAQKHLGVCYNMGRGVDKNLVEAVKWFRKAADQGDAEAQNNLGVCYANGDGVEKDPVEAVNCFRKAAEQGDAVAQFNLGNCYNNGVGVKKNPVEAVNWYRKAADQGHADAQFKLGVCYANGFGVKKNPVEAVLWYRKAAEQGHAQAQFVLGGCYYKGRGVEKNLVEAVKWYRKAAEQGLAEAQINLGICYAQGDGVEKNPVDAVKWVRKAADQGYENAQKLLRLLEK